MNQTIYMGIPVSVLLREAAAKTGGHQHYDLLEIAEGFEQGKLVINPELTQLKEQELGRVELLKIADPDAHHLVYLTIALNCAAITLLAPNKGTFAIWGVITIVAMVQWAKRWGVFGRKK